MSKKKDWKNNENYDKCFSQFDTMLVQTDTANAPWTIVEAMDKKFAVDKILTTIVNRLEQAVEKNQKKGNPETDSKSEDTDAYLQNSVLKGVDLTLSLTPEEYKKKKKDLQKRMEKLHNQMYLQRVPVVLAFEGWDAGGKAVPLSALPSVWMRVVMKWCQLLRQMISKKHIIICGGSGIIFQRTDTWQFLTAPGMEEC